MSAQEGKCPTCMQNLRIAGFAPSYYEDHETLAECIIALAERVHNLEFKEKMKERAAAYDDELDL